MATRKRSRRTKVTARPGEKNRVIAAEVIAKALQDETFKKELLRDPKKILEDAGVDDLPATAEVVAVENTPTSKYLVLPDPELLPTFREQLFKVLSAGLPLPEGTEVRMMQNSKSTRYLVIPTLPPNLPFAIDSTHIQLLAAEGWEAINAYTTANAVAEVNAAVWANVGAATEVAAAAAVVAVIGVVLI